ncbi:hypothetical protein ACFLU5_02045 [Bacteroidota bacterium]
MNRIIRFMRKGGVIILGLLLFFMGLASCTYHENKYVEPEVPDVVSFSDHVIPIFDQSCNEGCHAAGIPPDLSEDMAYTSLTTQGWLDTDDPENSSFYKSIDDGGIMYGYATDLDRAMILKWIEQGAENN